MRATLRGVRVMGVEEGEACRGWESTKIGERGNYRINERPIKAFLFLKELSLF
jgi:hypothetical protein